ncbi:MAG: phosphoribosylglycinamide formyltransferase [Bacteroidales bacterium]
MKRLAVFASGSGTNAQNLITHFSSGCLANIELIICNNENAYVIQRAKKLNIKSIVLTKDELTSATILHILKVHNIDFIVLAGYLLKIPAILINNYPNKIINIHPALLPKFGGKGMYGHHVHQAVIDAGEKETGITIHLVNEVYDSGKILFKATCPVLLTDTADDIAAKIHILEQENFPRVVEEYIKTNCL